MPKERFKRRFQNLKPNCSQHMKSSILRQQPSVRRLSPAKPFYWQKRSTADKFDRRKSSSSSPAMREAREEKKLHTSTHQNTLGGTHRCGRAPSARYTVKRTRQKAARVLWAPVQTSPRTLGEICPHGQILAQSLFSLLDRARPVFSFLRTRRKEKMGGASPDTPGPGVSSSRPRGADSEGIQIPRPRRGPGTIPPALHRAPMYCSR